jgi:hypothetical protein
MRMVLLTVSRSRGDVRDPLFTNTGSFRKIMAKSDKKDKTTTEDAAEDVEMVEPEVESVCSPVPLGSAKFKL